MKVTYATKEINNYSGFSAEMEKFLKLSDEKKEEIFKNVFLKIFNTFWGTKNPQNFIITNDKKKDVDLIIRARDNRYAEFYYKAESSFANNDFDLILVGRNAADSDIDKIEAELQTEIISLLAETAYCPTKVFNENFFNTLNEYGISSANNEDNTLHKDDISLANYDKYEKNIQLICSRAKELFPEFEQASSEKKEEVKNKALENALKDASMYSQVNHDITFLAKYFFMALVDEKMIDTLKLNEIEYEKISEHSHIRLMRDRKDPSKIWEEPVLIFVEYKYSTSNNNTFRTSFHVHELWSKLVPANNA
jgi:hypothetical protein